jgi:spoIIIJ-associated protein
MKTIQREGKSTSSVISGFMKEFNLQLEDFKFEVVEEGKRGFLGLISSKPTVIKFTVSDGADSIAEFTRNLLDHMMIEYEDVKVKEQNNDFEVEITGVKEAGFVIGKEARVLDALQHLVNQMINKEQKKSIRLELDVDGYRQRKAQQLVEKLKVVAERVKKTGRSYTFEPMNAVLRKTIHQFVEKEEKLQTMTIGRGESKRVVLSQVGKKPVENSSRHDRPVRNNRSPRRPRKNPDSSSSN